MKFERSQLLEFRDGSEPARAMITKVSTHELTILWSHSSEAERKDRAELEVLCREGRVVVLSEERDHMELLVEDFEPEVRDRVFFRLAVLKKIADAGIPCVTGREETERLIKQTAIEHGVPSPHWQTVRKWSERYRDGGYMLSSLVPHRRFQGNRRPRCSDAVQGYMIEAAEFVFKKTRRCFSVGYDRLESLIRVHNRNVVGRAATQGSEFTEEVEVCPSYETFRRFCRKRTYETVQIALFGARAYENSTRGQVRAVKASHILEFVEMDATELDIFLLPEAGSTASARPQITGCIDAYSGMVTGYYLSFFAPSYDSVRSVLGGSLTRKDSHIERFRCTSEWPAAGLPQTVVLDNARENWAASLSFSVAEVGVNVQYCPIRTPQFKGSIERFLGTLGTEVLQQMPGFIPDPKCTHSLYKAEREATVTFAEFEEDLCTWIVDIYHNTVWSDEIDTPLEKWERSKLSVPPREISADRARYSLLPCATRTLRRTGLRVLHLDYQSPQLKALYGRTGKRPVTIRWDPLEILFIYVKDEDNQTYLRIPCTDPEYAKGLTRAEHQRIRNHRTKIRKEKNRTPSLLEAKTSWMEKVMDKGSRRPSPGVRADKSLSRAIEEQRERDAHFESIRAQQEHAVELESTPEAEPCSVAWTVE